MPAPGQINIVVGFQKIHNLTRSKGDFSLGTFELPIMRLKGILGAGVMMMLNNMAAKGQVLDNLISLTPVFDGEDAEQDPYTPEPNIAGNESQSLVPVSQLDGVNVFVFNLEDDPYEKKNLADDEEYADVRAELEGRLDFFRGQEVTEDPELTRDNKVLGDAGGVVPFIDFDAPPQKPDTPRPEAALLGVPNLVFVLMDDVGGNDLGYEASTWIDFATPNMDALVADGVHLTRHYGGWVCAPTRCGLGALLRNIIVLVPLF